MGLKWPDDADDKVQELMDSKNTSVDFVVFRVSGRDDMELVEAGQGGRDKVEEICKDSTDAILTGCFMVLAVDDREVTVSIRRKFIHFIWVGPDVKVMAKGRVNSQSGEMKSKFEGAHIFLQISDVDDISEEKLEKTMLASGGAHTPTRYDFTNTTEEG